MTKWESFYLFGDGRSRFFYLRNLKWWVYDRWRRGDRHLQGSFLGRKWRPETTNRRSRRSRPPIRRRRGSGTRGSRPRTTRCPKGRPAPEPVSGRRGRLVRPWPRRTRPQIPLPTPRTPRSSQNPRPGRGKGRREVFLIHFMLLFL